MKVALSPIKQLLVIKETKNPSTNKRKKLSYKNSASRQRCVVGNKQETPDLNEMMTKKTTDKFSFYCVASPAPHWLIQNLKIVYN